MLIFSVKYEKVIHGVTGTEDALLVKKVDCEVPRSVGGWRLELEDWRLYETLQLGKSRILRIPYPQDPDKTEEEEPVGEGEGEEQETPAGPPEPQPGPSVSHQATQSEELEPSPSQQTPHPDPQARARDKAIRNYFENGRKTHKELVAAGRLYGIDYCKELALEESQKQLVTLQRGSVTCPVCKDGKEYTSTQKLKNHYRQKHTDIRKYVCATCSQNFSDTGALRRHLEEIHHTTTTKRAPPIPYTCRFCEEKGINWVNYSAGRYNAHIKEHEYKVKFGDYRCMYCHQEFQHKRTLESHMKDSCKKRPGAKDAGKKYVCPREGCGVRFTNKRSIPKHLRDFHPDDN